MHSLTGNRDQVLQLMNNTIQNMESGGSQAGAAGIGAESDADVSVVADLRMGFMEAQVEGATAAGLSGPALLSRPGANQSAAAVTNHDG